MFYIFQYTVNHLVEVARVVANTSNANSRNLPGFIAAHLGHRYIELVPYLRPERIDNLTLAFQAFVFGKSKVYFTNADLYCVSLENNKSQHAPNDSLGNDAPTL